MLTLKLLLLMLIPIQLNDAYRILGVFPINVKSHFAMFDQLITGLAEKGHRVDVVSFYPPTNVHPNVHHIIQIEGKQGSLTNNLTLEEIEKCDVLEFAAEIAGNILCDELGNPHLLQLVHNPPDDPPYDLLIIEIFGAQCFIVLGHLLKIPTIGITSAELYPWMHDLIATPKNLAWVPSNLLTNVHEHNLLSSFWWRLYNTVKTAHMMIKFNLITSKQNDIIRKYYGPEIPTVRELESKLALILANYHMSLSNIQPTSPALIQVGGLHIRDENNTSLSQDLNDWLNDAKEGFVYFSFGSMVKIESFRRENIDTLYKSLGKITPVRVIMKITDPNELPRNIPNNIYALSWAPQEQILKHPNIKAFITHGGILGTQEAVHYGVPMIGIPLFADQFKNINNYVRLNIAVKLDFHDLKEENLDYALNEILHNPLYWNSMKRVSQMFRDRPQSPLNTACYWVEYVIKYGDENLKPHTMQLNWWQISLLDIYTFLIIFFLMALYTLKMIIRKIINLYIKYQPIKVNKNE